MQYTKLAENLEHFPFLFFIFQDCNFGRNRQNVSKISMANFLYLYRSQPHLFFSSPNLIHLLRQLWAL